MLLFGSLPELYNNGSSDYCTNREKGRLTSRSESTFTQCCHRIQRMSHLALLTGGTFDPRAKVRTQRAEMKNKVTVGQPLSEQDRQNVAMGRGAPGGLRQGPIKALRKKMHEDVLYLLIAEIPTRPEMMELENMQRRS